MTETVPSDASIASLLAEAAVANREMRLADALAGYRAAADLDPDCYAAHLGAARTLTRMRRQDEAREAIERCLEIDPERAEAYAARGVLLFLVDENDDAAESLRRAVEIDPGDPESYLTLAQIEADAGRFETVAEQLALARERIAALPEEERPAMEAMAWHVETYSHLIAGENNAALEAAQEVVALEEANPYAACLAYSNLGILEARSRHYDQAIGYFERAFEMNPFFYRAGSALGRLLIVRNQPARAAEVLEQVMAALPESEENTGSTRYAYAVALRRAGRRYDALDQYRLALHEGLKGSDRLSTYWQLGWLHPIGRNVIVAVGLAAAAAYILLARPSASTLTFVLVLVVVLVLQRTFARRR